MKDNIKKGDIIIGLKNSLGVRCKDKLMKVYLTESRNLRVAYLTDQTKNGDKTFGHQTVSNDMGHFWVEEKDVKKI